MSLASLPYEAVLDIVDMCHTGDIISWSQTSRRSCSLLLPALYRSNIRRQKSSALFWAAENNKPILTAKILQYHTADINVVYDQSTPFIRAAEFGSESVINLLTTRADLDVNFQVDGRSALWLAASRGHAQVVRILIQQPSIRVDDIGFSGTTPLTASIIQGNLETVMVLLQSEKININDTGPDGMTPLLYALEQGFEHVAGYLLSRQNIDPACQDSIGRTPLAYAVNYNLLSTIRLLLRQAGSTIDIPDLHNETPLLAAIRAGRTEAARLLLEAGADTECVDIEGNVPLTLAMRSGIAMVQLLLDHDANINVTDPTGSTPLHHAADSTCEFYIMILLKYGGKINAQDRNGLTPLVNSIYAGHAGAVNLLLSDDRLDPNLAVEGYPPIHHAVFSGWDLILRLLCDTERVDLSQVDSSCRTALNASICHSSPSMMDILLSKRSVQHCLTSLKCVPPLCDAVKLSNHGAVRRLLRCSGIDVNMGWQQPPLLIAARTGDKQIARDLLRAGANINARDSRGSTVVSESTKGGHLGLLGLFLEYPEVNINPRDESGRTPLWWAAYNGYQHVFKYLLNHPRTRKDFSYHPPDFSRVIHDNNAIYMLTLGTPLQRHWARRSGRRYALRCNLK